MMISPLLMDRFWKTLAVAAILLSAFLAGWSRGSLNEVRKWSEREAKRSMETVKLAQARVQVVHATSVRVKKVVEVIRENRGTIEQEVPNYVPQAANDRCDLPVGFLRIYDAGLLNQPPGPATESDRESSGVALSDAAKAITFNNAILKECRSRLEEWGRFYQDLRLAKPAPE